MKNLKIQNIRGVWLVPEVLLLYRRRKWTRECEFKVLRSWKGCQ